jgi:predicted DNA-binding transcriptional regulator YafY
VLGHELQHAMEIAAAPDVRDTVTLRALYLRIGYERTNGGYYETDAALEVGRQVSAEVWAWRPPRQVAGK